MDKHPIENMMSATLENIRDMVDVNTVIGDPIQTADGSTVIPLSRVSFGFVAGGGEYTQKTTPPAAQEMPFAGGTGAGVTVHPMGFLVVSDESVRLLPAQHYAPVDRMIELAPQLMCEIKNALMKCCKKDAPESVPESNQPQQ